MVVRSAFRVSYLNVGPPIHAPPDAVLLGLVVLAGYCSVTTKVAVIAWMGNRIGIEALVKRVNGWLDPIGVALIGNQHNVELKLTVECLAVRPAVAVDEVRRRADFKRRGRAGDVEAIGFAGGVVAGHEIYYTL